MTKFILIFFSVICLCNSYKAFSCERSFRGKNTIEVDKLTIKDIHNLSPDEIAKLPAEEIHKFLPEQIKYLSFEQVLSLPLQHLLLEQVRYITYLHINNIISKNEQFQNDHPTTTSLLIRIGMRDISPYGIAFISPEQIRQWSEHDIKKLTPKQVQAFNSEQIIAFGKMVVHFSPEQLQAFGEKIQYFLPEQLKLFSYGQTGKLELAQLAVLSEKQLQNLGYINHFIH